MKVTQVTGLHVGTHSHDEIQGPGSDETYELIGMLPNESRNRRGRFTIHARFEPQEGKP